MAMAVRKSFKYKPVNPKSPSTRKEYQLPISFYLNDEEMDCPGLAIKVTYIPKLNLCVPFIADFLLDKWRPFEIPEDLFPELKKTSWDFKNLKMSTFRLHLPREIAQQYLYAELFRIPGFNFIPDIESGSVIRKLLEKIDERLYCMEYLKTFDTVLEILPKPLEA